jgi:GSH-dependent disulfide-bond oxidoreductase
MSSMILYHGEPNGPSLAVLAALFESGADSELRRIDLAAGDRHHIAGLTEPLARDMSVEGEGPVLVIDGEAMTESVFIAQFLDESERCAPAAAWLGCKASAAIGELPSGIVSEDLRARWTQIAAGDFPEAATADSVTKVSDAAKLVEDQLSDGRDWLMRDLTIADFETYAWLAGMIDLIPDAFAERPKLAAWLSRVKDRPSVARALSLASGGDPAQSWAPGPEINRWG